MTSLRMTVVLWVGRENEQRQVQVQVRMQMQMQRQLQRRNTGIHSTALLTKCLSNFAQDDGAVWDPEENGGTGFIAVAWVN
jgi:hypothetical protein